MESIKNFIKGKLSKKNSNNDIITVLNELSEKNNKFVKPYISTLLDTLNSESSKIYNSRDKISKQPSFTAKRSDDFWNMVGEYLRLEGVTINIVNPDKKSLYILNKDTCVLDNNNNVTRFTNIFKDVTFNDYVSRDKESEDMDDPENTGEGHERVSSRFGDNNWVTDFWHKLGRGENNRITGPVLADLILEFAVDMIKPADRKLILATLLKEQNTYIIFTENK